MNNDDNSDENGIHYHIHAENYFASEVGVIAKDESVVNRANITHSENGKQNENNAYNSRPNQTPVYEQGVKLLPNERILKSGKSLENGVTLSKKYSFVLTNLRLIKTYNSKTNIEFDIVYEINLKDIVNIKLGIVSYDLRITDKLGRNYDLILGSGFELRNIWNISIKTAIINCNNADNERVSQTNFSQNNFLFCSQCGKKIDSDAKFCKYCGAKIK